MYFIIQQLQTRDGSGPRDIPGTRAARHRPGGGVPARQPNVAAPLDQLRPAALLPRGRAAGAALPPRRSAGVAGAERRARAGAPGRWAPVRVVHEHGGPEAMGGGPSWEVDTAEIQAPAKLARRPLA